MRHEVVVYRSPAEAALWDFVTSASGSAIVLWLICAFVVYIAGAASENTIRRLPNWLLKPWAAIVFGVAATHLLFIAATWALTYL